MYSCLVLQVGVQTLRTQDSLDRSRPVLIVVTGQLTDTLTRGLPIGGLDDSRTGHLADWSTRTLDNSRTGQVADWTTRGCHRQLCVLSFHSFGGICETVSCPVRDLSSPRDVQSASWQSTSWRIHELSSYPNCLAELSVQYFGTIAALSAVKPIFK